MLRDQARPARCRPDPAARFLVGAAAAGAGLTVGLHVPLRRARRRPTGAAAGRPADRRLPAVAPDNTVTVLSAHFEMGQGSYTGVATLLAEELDADWSQMRAEGAWGNPTLYGNLAWGGAVQGTGGSTAMASSFQRYRQAGALARGMLVAAASKEWGVPGDRGPGREGCAEPSCLRQARHHGRAGRRGGAGRGGDAGGHAARDRCAAQGPGQVQLIGNPDLVRLDNVAKTTGAPVFTIDVRLPGMLTAVVAHPPRFGAKVKGFDAGGAKAVKGVVDVVEIPRGVAVVAETTWAAIKGREALTVDWDESGAETRGSDELLAEYRQRLEGGEVAVTRETAIFRAPSPPAPSASRRCSSSPTSPTRRWSR